MATRREIRWETCPTCEGNKYVLVGVFFKNAGGKWDVLDEEHACKTCNATGKVWRIVEVEDED